ncbi:DMT family transporter [Herbaspirillum sp. alder98]|uniref:DMT family transporter n=1 Tax=Herbaspirillum sp. alder98 TaxID=2913096 RepID=UPI001CD9134B|nr:DMT family transporter [Herbaspirillum sp. alder98]MCA1326724.1 DMT family transporter [Herbaspirillum sp. alder98]
MNDNLRGTLEMSVSMVISGTIGWLVVLSGRPVAEVVFWRCVFGAVALLPICLALGQLQRVSMTWRQFGLVLLVGLALVANWLLLFASYSRTSISIATAVYNTQPFMLVGMGALLLRERLTPIRVGCLLLSFSGVLLIVQGRPLSQDGGDYLVGVLMALAAALLYAVAAFITKQLKGVSPHLIALSQTLIGAVLLMPMAPDPGTVSPTAWPVLVAIGVVNTGIMYLLLYSAIQRLPTYLTGGLSFIYPAVAFIVDAWAFGHRMQWLQVLGAMAIFTGAAAMMAGERLRWPSWRRSDRRHEAGPVGTGQCPVNKN